MMLVQNSFLLGIASVAWEQTSANLTFLAAEIRLANIANFCLLDSKPREFPRRGKHRFRVSLWLCLCDAQSPIRFVFIAFYDVHFGDFSERHCAKISCKWQTFARRAKLQSRFGEMAFIKRIFLRVQKKDSRRLLLQNTPLVSVAYFDYIFSLLYISSCQAKLF